MAGITRFEVITNSAAIGNAPVARDPAEWHQAVGIARNICARIFRDGGKPQDAVATFGIADATGASDWSRAVDIIAEQMVQRAVKRAA